MLKKLLGMKDGTTRIKGVVGQFEGMITELETGSQMNVDRIDQNAAEVAVLETENQALEVTNTKASNVRDALLAIINGG